MGKKKKKKGAKAPETSGCLGLLILTAFLPCLEWQWILVGGIAFYVTYVASMSSKDWHTGCLALVMFVILAVLIRASSNNEEKPKREKHRTRVECDVFGNSKEKNLESDVFK